MEEDDTKVAGSGLDAWQGANEQWQPWQLQGKEGHQSWPPLSGAPVKKTWHQSLRTTKGKENPSQPYLYLSK